MLPNRYNLHNVKRTLRNPRLLLGEAAELGVAANRPVAARRHPPAEGRDVVAADWDTLLILDACRYDVFREVSTLPGTLRSAVSKGSESREFMRRNFGGRRLHDTVYVTANPHAETVLDDETFHHIEKLYLDRWDEAFGVCLPEVVAAAARDAAETYPEKRLVVHFMQPHAPYIGEYGRTVEHNEAHDPRAEVRAVWTNIRYGFTDTTTEQVRTAYRENLELVLEEVAGLSADLDGKTVVTADHGELLGDRLFPIPVRGYGHPPGLRAPGLIRVPWLELPCESRRAVRADPPQTTETTAERSVIERRLADLGYLPS